MCVCDKELYYYYYYYLTNYYSLISLCKKKNERKKGGGVFCELEEEHLEKWIMHELLVHTLCWRMVVNQLASVECLQTFIIIFDLKNKKSVL